MSADLAPVLAFLRCRTPDRWVEQAVQDRRHLLLDHATLELKAAQQAQKLIWKYGAVETRRSRRSGGSSMDDRFRSRLVHKMSRLAREELRHFEQVVALIERRGGRYEAVSPSRYAAGLHEHARREEPGALVDTLIVGAIIEARSCERFFCLLDPLRAVDTELAHFYASLLRAEARHFEDYLALARAASLDDEESFTSSMDALLDRDAELVSTRDTILRFHSGALA